VCELCGLVVADEQDAVVFPAFSANKRDPLHRFSDGVFHQACLSDHPDGARAIRRSEEIRSRLGPGQRACIVCGSQVRDPDDYLTFGFLCDDDAFAASRFNYAQIHRSHAHEWADLGIAIAALEELRGSGTWDPEPLGRLIAELRELAW
jgi:hypothetical protein